jgi:hypothetical protein
MTAPPAPASPSPQANHRLVVWLACGLGVATFLLNLPLERQFDQRAAFGQFDVLFDMDPNLRLQGISYGVEVFRLVHPNFGNYFRLPIAAVVKAASGTGLNPLSDAELTRFLGLLVTPAVSGCSVAVMLLLLTRLGLGTGPSLLLASLGALSFSQLIGGSVPEHFPLGGFGVAASLLLAATELRDGRSPLAWAWLALCVLAAGTTVTQIVPTLLLMVTSGVGSGWTWRQAARQVAMVGVCAGVLTYGSAFTLNRMLPPSESVSKAPVAARARQEHDEEGRVGVPASSKVWTLRENLSHHGRWVVRFLRLDSDPQEQLARIPEVLVNTLSPPNIGTQPLDRGQIQKGKHDFGFTLEKTGHWATMAIVLLLLVTGLMGSRHGSRGQQLITLAALGILLFNMVLHSLWGREFFLYSQHWLVSQIVLLAGNLSYPTRTRRAAFGLLMIIVPLVAFHNATLIWSMLQRLEGI